MGGRRRPRFAGASQATVRSDRAAWGAGLAKARGEFVALLGLGVVVADAWLDQLVALTGASFSIGMVAPMSKTAGSAQSMADVPYADPDYGLDPFARRWRDERRGRWSEAEPLSGQCLLVECGVLEVLGVGRSLRPAELRTTRMV